VDENRGLEEIVADLTLEVVPFQGGRSEPRMLFTHPLTPPTLCRV
jgi:hypothetical protein